MNVRTKAHAAVLAANVIFGINYSMVKFVTPNYMHPWALNLLRILISAIMLWGVFFLGKSNAGFNKKDLGRFLICAVCGVAVNQLLFTTGLSLTTSIHASLLALGTPIFITVIAAWLLKEYFTWKKILGLALGISGALLLIVSKTNHADANAKNILAGDVMVLINSISYAFYFVWVRPLMNHYSAVHVLRWTFTFGTFFILPFGLPHTLQTNWHALSTHAWLALAFVVVGATFFSYLMNIYSLKILGAGVTGSYIYTQPLFAAAIGIIFLNEPLGWVQIASALLIGLGVFVVNKQAIKK